MQEIPLGASAQAQVPVTVENTAAAMGSGTLPVFATPALCALCEQAAWRAAAPYLDEGWSTVGVAMQLEHVSPTPVGMTVRAEANVTRIDGRSLTFSVEAFDEHSRIGGGTHTRVVVCDERFLRKALEKSGS